MKIVQIADRILKAVYSMGRVGVSATHASLARAAGVSLFESEEALGLLEELGLIEAGRCRLTMRGLVAVSSPARARRHSPVVQAIELRRAA